MPELDEVVREFLIESHENLDRLDLELVTLEREPDNRETLASIFRTIHTIKGTCGFLGFSRLEALSHAGESLLARLRDGEIRMTPEIATALLAMVDVIRRILSCIERTSAEEPGDDSALIARLRALVTAGAGDKAPASAKPELQDPVEWRLEPPVPDLPAPDSPADAPAVLGPGAVKDNTIRVEVGLLDNLMTLVGELVLTRNRILQLNSALQSNGIGIAASRLDSVTTELQEGIMKTRMQPVRHAWGHVPRLVRDTARACGKRARVESSGSDTELDKRLLEAIRDPVTHLVRNAVDHGIEPPETRLARGKPAEGLISLRAWHESGQVNIEIEDDGGGIDTGRVRRRAVESGRVSAERAARMSQADALQMIFLPGLSTAEQVTNLSGRGVGMDVVKNNIEKIGGTVEIASRPAEGVTVRIRIPLTLAIIPALIVSDGSERYAIPQAHLLELVRLENEEAGMADPGIEMCHGARVYRLRGRLLPLVDFDTEIGGARSARSASRPGANGQPIHIVVLQAESRRFGLIVSGIHDSEEIVVKPLGRHLNGIAAFAGATILGDGRVALILDVPGLARRAGFTLDEAEADLPAVRAEDPAARRGEVRETLLLCGAPDGGRMAVPLASVARLEEIPLASIERAGDVDVVQYRGTLMPLLRLGGGVSEPSPSPAPAAAADGPAALRVVVFYEGAGFAGLVVDEILEIVSEPVSLHTGASRDGVLGTAIIQDRVTDILDLRTLSRLATFALSAPAMLAEA